MADDAGTPPESVEEAEQTSGLAFASTADAVRGYGFYQALRLIERSHPEMPRLGEANHAADEPVRLGQNPSLAFEGASFSSYEAPEDGRPGRLAVGFLGVFGPHGPLPTHITEYAYQRAHNHHDYTLSRFADMLQHRLLTLFYRAWANAQPAVCHDRPEQDSFARQLGAIAGLSNQPAALRDADLDRFTLYMAGHFASRTRHPEGLAKMLRAFFGVSVAIEEFVAEWLTVPDHYCWALGKGASGEVFGKLGLGTRLGKRVLSYQNKFRVVLGPLSRAQYERFLPGGSFVPKLVALVQRYTGRELAWDVKLVLAEMAPTRLGKAGRLGRDSYLVRLGGRDTKTQDLVYDPLAKAG